MKLPHRFQFLISKSRFISTAVLVMLFCIALLGVFALKRLSTDYSVRQFINAKHPLLVSEGAVKNDFSLSENPSLYVTVVMNRAESGTFLTRERILALKRATEASANLSGVVRTVSLATVEGALSTPEGLTVSKLLDLMPPEQWPDRVMNDPLLTPSLISKDGRSTLVAVDIRDADTKTLATLPGDLRQTFKNQFPYSEIHIGGIPAIQGEMGILLKEELKHFVILGLLVCLLTLAAFFKDKPSIFVPILLVGFANIGALSFMALMKVPFTVLSTTLPVLVSILVLSMVTHTMINFSSDWAHELKLALRPGLKQKARTVFKTMQTLFLPNLLTALTTAFGFVALLSSGIPLIRDYAMSVSIGIMIAWACVMLALPPILVLMPPPVPRSWTASKARWSLHVERHKKVIVVSMALVALGLFIKGQNLNWSAKLFDDLPQNREARTTSEWIDQKLGAIIPLDVVIQSKGQNKEVDAWNDPVRMKSLSELLNKVRAIPSVGTAVGISDFVKAGALAQHKPMPTTRAGIAELIFLYSLSPERITNQFVTSDGTQARLMVRLRDIPADEMAATVNQIKVLAQTEFPGLEVKTSGMAANVHVINNELCKDLIYGFWQAIILISLILLVIFRSFRWTFVAMVPNLISPLALLGVMAWTQTPIKPGIALIFSIALGIAYNNTVYLLGRVKLLRDKSLARGVSSKALPITKAWYQEGNPCIFSTLALVGGFVVFMASYFQLNRLFGAYMLLSIVAGMIGDLVFLPALLGWFPSLLSESVPRLSQMVEFEEVTQH